MYLVEITSQFQLHFFLAKTRVIIHVSVEIDCVAEFYKYFAKLTLSHLENALEELKETDFLVGATNHFIC